MVTANHFVFFSWYESLLYTEHFITNKKKKRITNDHMRKELWDLSKWNDCCLYPWWDLKISFNSFFLHHTCVPLLFVVVVVVAACLVSVWCMHACMFIRFQLICICIIYFRFVIFMREFLYNLNKFCFLLSK